MGRLPARGTATELLVLEDKIGRPDVCYLGGQQLEVMLRFRLLLLPPYHLLCYFPGGAAVGAQLYRPGEIL